MPTITLQLDTSDKWPKEYAGIRAYLEGDVVHLRMPFHHRILGGVGAVWHEAEHHADPTFGNEQHHPIHYLIVGCVRSKGLWRVPAHAEKITRDQASTLLETGRLDY